MNSISILGVYVADLAFFADEIPIIGETIIGKEYFIGPGGKNIKAISAEYECEVNVDDDGILTFPPELLKETGWEEGDSLQWIDNEDGSFTLRKDETKQDRTE